MRTGYDTAQICLNGHEVNSCSASQPEFNADFCKDWGARTIRSCLSCSAAIRGYFHVPGVLSAGGLDVPAHCHACGKPYPWTDAKIQAAKELSDELSELNEEEREQLKKSIDDIVADTPRTPLAATRFKRLAGKAGIGALEAFKSILTSVLTEGAKKILFP
jgi:hypothetical protein